MGTRQFYRRALPSSCVDFASDKGKKLFSEALKFGFMNIYFKLASQFRTQEEPAFCGISTLVMVLNALEVDPGRVWKAPWRWYHESMLDCCKPLEQIKNHGITLDQFTCLALCNRLKTNTVYATDCHEESIAKFRDSVKQSAQSEDTVVVVSYDRRSLGQTGSGHFSPIGGYEPNSDTVLILDVARFKYPPHWVSVPLVYTAMTGLDAATGRSRGYSVLKLSPCTRPLALFRVNFGLGANLLALDRLKLWKNWLDDSNFDQETVLSQSIDRFMQIFGDVPICCKEDLEKKCCDDTDTEGSRPMCECCIEIEQDIRKTHIFRTMERAQTTSNRHGKLLVGLCAGFLACSLDETRQSEKSMVISRNVFADMELLGNDARNEIQQLNLQIRVMLASKE